MPGRHCFLFQSGADPAISRFALQVLRPMGEVVSIGLPQLVEIPLSFAAEMGLLIVPYDPDIALPELCEAVLALRSAGVRLSVLCLTAQSAVAATVTLGTVFDDVISIDWASSADKIVNFAHQHRQGRHDRAFRSFLDTAVDGYWIWDIDRDLVEWSQRTCDMTGRTQAQSPESIQAFTALIHPQDRDRVQQAIANHFHHGSPYRNIEFRLMAGNGSYGDYVANGQALRNEQGQPILLVGSLTDRSLIARVEQQLEDTQRRFTLLFHRMNDAAVLADIETGLILEANEPAERLWGKSIAELVGSHQTALHPPALSAETRKAFNDHIKALMHNNRASIQVPALRKDGTLVPTEISSSLIEIGGKTMILGVFRDITDREKAQQEIRERDAQIQLSSHLAAMGTLAAGVAHEMNNPLTYVLGNLEFMRDYMATQPDCPADVVEALTSASTGAQYLREIVTDLKTISRMDAAESQCNPAEVIRIATRMAMSDLRHRAQLNLNLQDVPMVPISSARLTQVALNIFSNAARSFVTSDRQQNHINVSVTATPEGVRLEVQDNGMGIAPEDLTRVFDPFFTRNRTAGGTGLGLSICRRILSEVGGRLDLTSDLGGGTTVSVILPTMGARDTASHAAPAASLPATRRGRIMVLDDDILVSRLIAQILRRDFDVALFNSPKAALVDLQNGARFDVILCDLMMPDLSGAAFHAAVLALPGQAPPFLFLTGGGVTEESIEMERRMAQQGRLMFKPFQSDDLRAKLHGVLAQTPAVLAVNPSVLTDLEQALGPRRLTAQFQRLAADLAQAQSQLPGLLAAQSWAAIAILTHRVAGGAGLLGLEPLHHTLVACAKLTSDPAQLSRAATDLPALLDRLPDHAAALHQLIRSRDARAN